MGYAARDSMTDMWIRVPLVVLFLAMTSPLACDIIYNVGAMNIVLNMSRAMAMQGEWATWIVVIVSSGFRIQLRGVLYPGNI